MKSKTSSIYIILLTYFFTYIHRQKNYEKKQKKISRNKTSCSVDGMAEKRRKKRPALTLQKKRKTKIDPVITSYTGIVYSESWSWSLWLPYV